MEQQVDKLQISAEGIVALPHSLLSRLDLRLGDEILARVDGGKIILHRMNPRRGPRSGPRPVGFGSGDFHFPEGWDAPMNDDEVDDFLNGR
jgi:bifunctional DNA-binding transcriptional regulator/antitoxin component of YhaV-PrlF toxin-antitoxin module